MHRRGGDHRVKIGIGKLHILEACLHHLHRAGCLLDERGELWTP